MRKTLEGFKETQIIERTKVLAHTLLISWLWKMYAIIFDPDPHSHTGLDITYTTAIKQAGAWRCLESAHKHQRTPPPRHRFLLMNPHRTGTGKQNPSSFQRVIYRYEHKH